MQYKILCVLEHAQGTCSKALKCQLSWNIHTPWPLLTVQSNTGQ